MLNQSHVTNCPICDESNCFVYATKGQFDMPLSLSICKNDGMVFLNPRWSSFDYHRFYENDYDRYYRPKQIISNDNESLKTKELGKRLHDQIIKRLSKYVNDSLFNEVLELGSGPGHILLNFSLLYNSNVSAIEPSFSCQKELSIKKIKIVADDLSADWQIDLKEKFSFIYSRHVLEHTLNPLEILHKVHYALSDEGLFYLSVPNTLQPMRSLRGFWFRIVHTYYFSEITLAALCLKSNFIVLCKHFDRGHSDMTFILKKNMSTTKSDVIELKYHFYRVLLFFITYDVKYFFKIFIKFPCKFLKESFKKIEKR